MAVRRVFLGWKQPALAAAADYLFRECAASGPLDLAGTAVVLPGSRAGRRLLEILVEHGDRGGRAVVPPAILTVGALAEMLYSQDRPCADALTGQLAWVQALRRVAAAELEHVFPTMPPDEDLGAWLWLGQMLARLHRELAGEGLDFAAVARFKGRLEGFGPAESKRWEVLSQVQAEYLRVLDEVELADLETARLLALRRGEVTSDAQIVLVGVVELSGTLRQMLERVSERVTALVFAPEELADRFDAYGCLRAEAWQQTALSLADEQIEVVGDPAEQAAAAVRAIGSLAGRYRADEITVGVPDRRILPYLQQQFEQSGVPARDSVGTPVGQTGPCRLLRAAAEYLQRRRFSALAALVRHPAVEAWLDEQAPGADWLTQMDDYAAEHLPDTAPEAGSLPAGYGALGKVCQAVERLLAPLAGPARPLAGWGEPIVNVLATLYGRTTLDPATEPDRTLLAACDCIHEVLRAHRSIRGPLMPSVTGTEAIHLLLRQVEQETIPPASREAAIEMLGWLELPLDDAPVLVVTGLNEGVVPSSLHADLFLPNRLRFALGIEDNQQRYARDAYALAALAASRTELRIIAGRRTAEGDPLAPSRLLFACEAERAARRVLRFLAQEEPAGTAAPAAAPPTHRAVTIPRPRPLSEPVRAMRVTEFRDYLACPYRYYLRHRLGLSARSDWAVELDGAAFGFLAHAVLSRFGQDPVNRSTDADQIRSFLDEALDRVVAETYGERPLPAVRVQIEQLRLRLAAFARWQAEWAGQGWHIEHAEICPQGAAMIVDGQPMELRGRIDRVDVDGSGRRIVFDYKTADTPSRPDQTHRQDGRWIDLQLPLYRHLLLGAGIEGPVGLGYVVLPKDTSRVGELLAEWTEDELREAEATAAEVIRRVRAEVFWPPTTPPPGGFGEFAAICQDDQFVARLVAEEGASAP